MKWHTALVESGASQHRMASSSSTPASDFHLYTCAHVLNSFLLPIGLLSTVHHQFNTVLTRTQEVDNT